MTDDNEETRGAPEGNDNAEKHGVYSDRELLYQRLSDHEQQLVVDISTDLLDRFEGEVGAYEREAIRNAAVDTVKRRRANEYIVAQELIKDNSEASERANKAYSRLVKDTTRELEKLGLLQDGPAMKSADAQEGWFSKLADASSSDDD
jgi:uncharacterized protein YjcR